MLSSFGGFLKMFYYLIIAPNIMSYLPFGEVFEESGTQRNKFGAEMWRRWSIVYF